MSSFIEKRFGPGASALPPQAQISMLSEGMIISSTLALAAELGIADLLAGGPRHIEELAKATSTHPRALYRMLRLLCSVGVFTEIDPDSFAQTPLSECLRTGVPGSMRAWLRMTGLTNRYQMYAEALYSLKTGDPVFERITGKTFFEHNAAEPKEGEIFNQAMNDMGQGVAAAVLEAYDFSGFSKIIDVGGGHGTLITAILRKYPDMKGILFDQTHIVEGASKAIAAAGLADRCEAVGGNFFDTVPAGCDAYLLRWIIHDWGHDDAITILKNCRQAMGDGGRLLLMEMILPDGNQYHTAKVLDYFMLLAMRGRERSLDEYTSLLREAGLHINKVQPTNSPMSILEAMPG